MMEYMRDEMQDTMVLHVGHRPGLEPFHDREIHLTREEGGPAFAEERPIGLGRRLIRRLRPGRAEPPGPKV